VFESLAEDETRVAPLALRVACGHRACPLGAAAIVPLRLSDGPVGALVAYATDGAPLADDDVDLLTSLGDQLSAQLQLSELAGSARAAASAELKALQAEIEPHFLFNCLNTIASFIRTDPDRARELILAFADYCRWTLARPGEFITLAEELKHVQSYLALEQARFGPQLEVEIDATPDALAVRLPPFLVQPLVENAVKHGKTERPLRLVIRARIRRGRLRVTVRDDGRGIAREALDRVLEPRVGAGAGDEEPARGELRYLLAAHPEVEVVGEAATSAEALALAGSVRYDVVFLDIELPGMTGLEVARLVLDRSERPRVVFVTAHDRYAVDAFAVEAFDYLVKPVEPERLARVVERLLQARTGEAPAVEK